jgi:hypothetical protein
MNIKIVDGCELCYLHDPPRKQEVQGPWLLTLCVHTVPWSGHYILVPFKIIRTKIIDGCNLFYLVQHDSSFPETGARLAAGDFNKYKIQGHSTRRKREQSKM